MQDIKQRKLIETLLRHYPEHWRVWQNRRAVVMGRYWAVPGQYRGFRRTDKAAISLVLLDHHYKLLQAVEKWINEELPAEERVFLIAVWRYKEWQILAQKMRCSMTTILIRWAKLLGSVKLYAGTVLDAAGSVCVSGQKIGKGEQ